VKFQPFDFGTLFTQVQQAGPTGNGPDLWDCNFDWTGKLISAGLLAPVELGAKGAQFDKRSVAGYTQNGALYALPLTLESTNVFRNPALIPKRVETWDQFTGIAAGLAAKGVRYPFLHVPNAYVFNSMLTAFGGYLYKPPSATGTVNSKDVGIDNAGAIAALSYYAMLATVRVVVCNDGGVAGADCSDEVIAVAASLGVECVTRTEGGGAKAGNFENARAAVGATGSALLVIFDADQIPHDDFFLATLPPFADPGVGWVQTGQYYRNRANPVARWADDQQSLFYRLLCPAKAAHDAAFICGTNVVIRAAALDEIGGLPTDSVTEDFGASIMLAPRWRSVYLSGVFATGLGPVDMVSYLRQQERWARGTLTVLRRHWRDLLLPRRGGLRAQQRLQYGLAVTHYLAGVRDLVFVVAPVLFLLTGISGVRGATFGQFLEHFVPYYALAVIAFWHAAWKTTSWRAIVIGFASAPALIQATWMTLVGQRGRFVLTPKRRTTTSGWRTAGPYLISLLACGAALVVAVAVHRSPSHWLSAGWLAYLSGTLLVTLGLLRADVRLGRREAAADAVGSGASTAPPRRLHGRRSSAVNAAAGSTPVGRGGSRSCRGG